MQQIDDSDTEILVEVSDMGQPDYSPKSNILYFNIKKKDIELFIKICEDSNLCVSITFDFSLNKEDK